MSIVVLKNEFNMNEMFAPVKLLLKPKKENSFNFTFNLHTKYTVVIMVACSLLLCAQFAREPITCLPGSKLLQEKMMDAFCWVNGTFTLPEVWLSKDGSVAPGVGITYQDAPKKYQYYYQWLSIILLVQACLFYLPRYVWKMWEGHVLESLLPAADNPSNADAKVESASEPVNNNQSCGSKTPPYSPQLVKFFLYNSYRRKAFMSKFLICELLNVTNVIAQLLLINYIFSDCFLLYGYNVIRFFFSSDQREFYISPMDEIFPKLAKCTFHKFGPSGTVEVVDSLCLLGWNIIFEKIYFMIWWLFVVLMFFSTANWLVRILTLCSRKFRVYVLKNVAFFTRTSTLEKIARKANFSDIFILCKVAKQMKQEAFENLLEELSRKL